MTTLAVLSVLPAMGLDLNMITIQILESNDKVRPDDWCRPLQIVSMNGGLSDYYSFDSEYSGRPENNAKWVPVSEVFGEYWLGHTVSEICTDGHTYEFVRGSIPLSHQYGRTKRQRRKDFDAYQNTIVNFGKYKGRLTLIQIERQDPRYYDWAYRNGIIKSLDDF